MILLDTNVISEPMKPRPDAAVMAWLDAQPVEDVYISTVTVAELEYGIRLLPEGRRRDSLQAALSDLLEIEFANRIWSFDLPASRNYGEIPASRRAAGLPISTQDCQIAAVARSRGAVVATRNVDDFKGCNVQIVNPWNQPIE